MTSAAPIKRILQSAPKRDAGPDVGAATGATSSSRPQSDKRTTAAAAAQDAKKSAAAAAAPKKAPKTHTTCVTIFSASGRFVLAGTSRGWLNVIDTASCATLHSAPLSKGVVIFLRLTPSGRAMVVNSSDRIIRTVLLPDCLSRTDPTPSASASTSASGSASAPGSFSPSGAVTSGPGPGSGSGSGSALAVNGILADGTADSDPNHHHNNNNDGGGGGIVSDSALASALAAIEVEHKFQDVVNRLSWNHVAFSSTGEYVMASTYKNHDIYVWERSQGSLVKILEGPKEELGVVEVRQ